MRSIWAVAANTIKQAVRMKVAVVFMVLLIILLPLMGTVMTGDGTIKGRLQTFVSYGLSLVSLLLCLFTIGISVFSLTSDFKQKQIYTVLTKPIRRSQLLLGKLLGVILLDVVLLTLFCAVIYGITIYMPKFFNATQEQLVQLRNEFFTARASLVPADVDVTKEVEQAYEKLEKEGQIEQMFQNVPKKSIIAELAMRKKLEKRAAAAGHNLLWEFNNVKPLGLNQSLFIRFKYDVSVNPADLSIYSRWSIGDYRQLKYGGNVETPIYQFDRKDLIRTFYEIEVPIDAIAKDGYLAVGYLNLPLNNTIVIFPPDNGLEVLYKADTFTANFLRAVFLILFRLIFLAVLGVLTSSFLSFPVAILLCLVVFLTGTVSGFIIESFDFLNQNVSGVYSYTIRPIVQLLPQFDKSDPSTFLVPARLLSWELLARIGGLLICVKAVIVFVIALLVFGCREIAKVII